MNQKTEFTPDIDLSELSQESISISLTYEQVQSVLMLISLTTIGDLERMDYPNSLLKSLNQAKMAFAQAQKQMLRNELEGAKNP